MDVSDELLDQINAYLAGTLTPADRAQFEVRLAQDANLRAEVAVQQELKMGLRLLVEKERFRAIHATLSQRGLLARPDEAAPRSEAADPAPAPLTEPDAPTTDQPGRIRTLWRTVAVAASAVVILGIGWFFFQQQDRATNQLAASERVFRMYFSAQPKLRPALPTDPDRVGAPNQAPAADSVQLRRGLSALTGRQTQQAIDLLQPLANAAPGHWSATAQWYLALAYLRTNQPDASKTLLRQISTTAGHPYQLEAEEMLQTLAEL